MAAPSVVEAAIEIIADATTPSSVVVAAASPDDYESLVEQAITASQEKLEKRTTRSAHNRVVAKFEEFRQGRPLSVALMDDFLHSLEPTAGRDDPSKKSAPTMWTYRSHLLKYLLQKYHVDYSNEGSYRVSFFPSLFSNLNFRLDFSCFA